MKDRFNIRILMEAEKKKLKISLKLLKLKSIKKIKK
jgi:hypothetical protein